eukprot:CAMPEP_0113281804 /NCGR_PEP_ID=MMETSP0008_2-20120614/28494_1 /TAXON_ID=97485 /ORGANISM="Prymnesium parvum" /LENGTH=319 /DNA_ID=CAMNT_0000132241 /DNA_START=211 /DNA_END=1166 /DNA_ORIENTATION=- /assembly_acc=CAM_ASM_000153
MQNNRSKQRTTGRAQSREAMGMGSHPRSRTPSVGRALGRRGARVLLLPEALRLVERRLLRAARLEVRRGGAVQRIEPAEGAVAAVESLVVEVVEVGLLVEACYPRQSVPRVVRLRAEARPRDPHEDEEDVRAEDEESGGEWDEVGDDELDGVGVQRRQRVGRGELVVDLMDPPVQRALVQRPVAVEEEHLVDEDVRRQHPRALAVRRRRAEEADAACAVGGDGDVRRGDDVRHADQHQLRDGGAQHVEDARAVDRLVRLDLVGCGRRPQLERQEEEAVDDVRHEEEGEGVQPERVAREALERVAPPRDHAFDESLPRGV